MINFVCWLWAPTGWRRGYRTQHVEVLQRMLAEHCSLPHRLICFTDFATNYGFANVAAFPMWRDKRLKVTTRPGHPNCYQRLKLFDPEFCQGLLLQPGDRVVSIDLDVILLDDIAPLFDLDADFQIVKGRASPYNGSMWSLRLGAHPEVYTDFDASAPARAAAQRSADGRAYYGSDQAWIAYKLPGVPTWGQDQGVFAFSDYWSRNNEALLLDRKPCRMVHFAGGMKPWDGSLARHYPRLHRLYGARLAAVG